MIDDDKKERGDWNLREISHRFQSSFTADGQPSRIHEPRRLPPPAPLLDFSLPCECLAQLHHRGVHGFVQPIGGVMTGISFFLLNDLFGYFGNLRNWSSWLTSAAPGLLYSLLSLSAFGWLVLRR